MKDLLEKVLKVLPSYFEELLGLVSGPKRFVGTTLIPDESPLRKGLVFLVITHALCFALTAPLEEGDLWTELGSGGLFTFAYIVGYGAALCLAWKVVSRTADVRKVLAIHLYYSSVLEFMLKGLVWVNVGLMKVVDPAVHASVMEYVRNGQAVKAASLIADKDPGMALALGGLGSAGFLMMGAWVAVGWGAYRELNRVSRLRSVVAFVLFSLFALPIWAFTTLIATALSTTPSRP